MSSGQPPAAIAVIRISGPAAIAAATALAGSLPPPRYAALRALRDRDGEILDRALVLVFPGPDSATGDDLVELHCHGGRAVVEAVERALHREPGIRRAEPGEFTRRALVHGRIDLNEAEGLADLLAAETELQRRHALMAAEGRVSGMVRGWLDRLAGLSARVEASIDYAEEGDLAAEADLLAGVVADQQSLAADMDAVLAVPPVERWRDGIRIVVAGPPNAGKSTLVNALAGRDAAIVSPIAGTTRDRIEVVVQRDGVGYVLIDTAGLREMTDDPIEQIGIERARNAVASAQVMLWLSDDDPPDGGSLVMRVHAKADLPGRAGPIPGSVRVSAWQPSTVESLWEEIAERSATLIPSGGGMALHRRAHDACVECREAIGEAPVDVVLHAERLRRGHRAVARALGVDATASMLDALFTRFCVGK